MHGVEEADGVRALVLKLVAGQIRATDAVLAFLSVAATSWAVMALARAL